MLSSSSNVEIVVVVVVIVVVVVVGWWWWWWWWKWGRWRGGSDRLGDARGMEECINSSHIANFMTFCGLYQPTCYTHNPASLLLSTLPLRQPFILERRKKKSHGSEWHTRRCKVNISKPLYFYFSVSHP